MADDLDDDFIPDDAFDDAQEADTESDHDEPVAETDADKNSKKRKRRLRDRERFKEKKRIKLASGNGDSAAERSVAEQSPDELADYLATLQSKAYGKLSVLELEDMRIPATSIADTTMWTDSRTLDNFPDFVAKVLPGLRLRLSQKSKSNGAPTLLFLAGAALRVADIYRALKDNRLRGDKGGEVAKLFARHFKVAEHVSYLRRTKIGSAVGTPGRVGKLLEADALSVSQLSHIILDTFRDAKKRTMLDIPETREEVFRTVLGHPAVLQGIKSGKIQVVLL
ncbi:Protein cms1 [Mycena chlorophos]|uniref:Protein cms1 n=1 Tax=Mycena chlorophos TaxID=658473 RepID=A0A8H6WL95_MYCCL|nr:Protein cms1 [Mycena chlorophos]